MKPPPKRFKQEEGWETPQAHTRNKTLIDPARTALHKSECSLGLAVTITQQRWLYDTALLICQIKYQVHCCCCRYQAKRTYQVLVFTGRLLYDLNQEVSSIPTPGALTTKGDFFVQSCTGDDDDVFWRWGGGGRREDRPEGSPHSPGRKNNPSAYTSIHPTWIPKHGVVVSRGWRFTIDTILPGVVSPQHRPKVSKSGIRGRQNFAQTLSSSTVVRK